MDIYHKYPCSQVDIICYFLDCFLNVMLWFCPNVFILYSTRPALYEKHLEITSVMI